MMGWGRIGDLFLGEGRGERDGVDEVGGGGEEGASALRIDGGGDEGLAIYPELELLREPRHKAQVLHLAAAAALPTSRVLVGGSSRSFYLVCLCISLARSLVGARWRRQPAAAVGGREAAAAVGGSREGTAAVFCSVEEIG